MTTNRPIRYEPIASFWSGPNEAFGENPDAVQVIWDSSGKYNDAKAI